MIWERVIYLFWVGHGCDAWGGSISSELLMCGRGVYICQDIIDVCFFVCCSDCVGVSENVWCIAAVIEDSGFFLYFIIFQVAPIYYIIFIHAILHFYHIFPSSSLFSISCTLIQHIMLFCFDLPTHTTLIIILPCRNIRSTNSLAKTYYIYACILPHNVELHPVSIKHILPISDIRLSSNTTRNIYSTVPFASLSSKVLQPVFPLISSFLTLSTSQSHIPIPFLFPNITIFLVPC